MSWLNLVTRDLVIVTGDGKRYVPNYMGAKRGKEFNVVEHEFSDLDGTLVKKNRPKGMRYPLELYFTGADHLDISNAFSASADDTRPWKLEHPYYGLLTVQPVTSLDFDNTAHNVTKINLVVMETIVEDTPRVNVDPVEQIKLKKIELNTSFELAFKSKPKAAEVNSMSSSAKKNYQLSVPIIKIPEQFQTYTNLFNVAISAVNTATASPLLAMRKLIALANYPANLQQSVKDRVSLLVDQFGTLRQTINGTITLSGKQIYQNHAGSIVSAIALATVTPITGDYKINKEVHQTIDKLIKVYTNYIEDLDFLQTDNGGMINSFVPDAASIVNLSQLINLTVSSLFSIAFKAKKEKSILCEKDTNIILLTHRFYGLDVDDNNIAEFVEQNNFSLDERLVIRKGRKIYYYV